MAKKAASTSKAKSQMRAAPKKVAPKSNPLGKASMRPGANMAPLIGLAATALGAGMKGKRK